MICMHRCESYVPKGGGERDEFDFGQEKNETKIEY